MHYLFAGTPDPQVESVIHGLGRVLKRNHHHPTHAPDSADLVLHAVRNDAPRPYRRRGRGVFVVGVCAMDGGNYSVEALYPMLVRTLSNLLVVLPSDEPPGIAHLITPEQGHVTVRSADADEGFYESLYARLEPLATSRMVIENIFTPDLEPALWDGDEHTAAIGRAGKFLADLKLLPAPFPIEEILSPREMRHLKLLYGMGGLSYGNFSARLDDKRFWMSASGVDKSNLREIGRDILLVTGYDPERGAMHLSVPPNVEPRRVSVDAIEHWLVYRENPGVGAILHVHAWMTGAPSTEMQYPCGTYELGRAVADLVRAAPDPTRAVVGLKNHGLTITGASLDEILARVSGQLVRNVPMS